MNQISTEGENHNIILYYKNIITGATEPTAASPHLGKLELGFFDVFFKYVFY